MTIRNRIFILLILLTIGITYGGIMLYGPFYMWALPEIPNVKYQTTNISGQFLDAVVFGGILSLVPWAIFIVCKYGKVRSGKSRILSSGAILLFSCLGLFARQQWIKIRAEDYTRHTDSFSLINLAEIKFEYYIFGGMVLGSIIALLLFRK